MKTTGVLFQALCYHKFSPRLSPSFLAHSLLICFFFLSPLIHLTTSVITLYLPPHRHYFLFLLPYLYLSIHTKIHHTQLPQQLTCSSSLLMPCSSFFFPKPLSDVPIFPSLCMHGWFALTKELSSLPSPIHEALSADTFSVCRCGIILLYAFRFLSF